jgi:hypothetical protein
MPLNITSSPKSTAIDRGELDSPEFYTPQVLVGEPHSVTQKSDSELQINEYEEYIAALKHDVSANIGKDRKGAKELLRCICDCADSIAALKREVNVLARQDSLGAVGEMAVVSVPEREAKILQLCDVSLARLCALRKMVNTHAASLGPSLKAVTISTLSVLAIGVAVVVGVGFALTPVGAAVLIVGLCGAFALAGLAGTGLLLRQICAMPKSYDEFNSKEHEAMKFIFAARSIALDGLIINREKWHALLRHGGADAIEPIVSACLALGNEALIVRILQGKDASNHTLFYHLIKSGDVDCSRRFLELVRRSGLSERSVKKVLMLCDVDLSDRNLSYLDLRGVSFAGSKLKNTVFAGSDLSGAIFDGVEVSILDLSEAKVNGCSFCSLNIGEIILPTKPYMGAGIIAPDRSTARDFKRRELRPLTSKLYRDRHLIREARERGEKFYTTTYMKGFAVDAPAGRGQVAVNGIKVRNYADPNLANEEGMPKMLGTYIPASRASSKALQIGKGSESTVSHAPRGFVEGHFDLKPYNLATAPDFREISDLRSFIVSVRIDEHTWVARNAGGSLENARVHIDPPLPLDAFFQSSADLAMAHARGIYHRDIKAENMTFKDGQTYFIDLSFMTTNKPGDKIQPSGTSSHMDYRIISEKYKEHLKTQDDLGLLITIMGTTEPRVGLAMKYNDFHKVNFYDPDGRTAEKRAWIEQNIAPEYREGVARFLANPEADALPFAVHEAIVWS